MNKNMNSTASLLSLHIPDEPPRRKSTAVPPGTVDFGSARSTRSREEEVMCPVCLTATALAVASATSAGGLGALAVKKLRARTGAPASAKGEDRRTR